jgi:hypothetical protein
VGLRFFFVCDSVAQCYVLHQPDTRSVPNGYGNAGP